MRAYIRLVLLILGSMAIFCTNSFANPVTSIPSCYAALGLPVPQSSNKTEVFVLIDQTVTLDPNLKNDLLSNALRFAVPGNSFRVLQFSAFNQGRYMDVVGAGAIEEGLSSSARDAIGVDTLAELDDCLARQSNYGRRLMASSIDEATDGANSGLAKSDIIGSLRALSELVARSTASKKIVIVVSDMLENSTVTSFYRRGGVRRIDSDSELAKIEKLKLFGNFAGAQIFVLGAGLLPPANTTGSAEVAGSNLAYRDPLTLDALKLFWSCYFTKSNGKLIEFGEPAFLFPVK